MHILNTNSSLQTITIVPREYVFSSEDLDLYFERVVLDGGTVEGATCCQDKIEDLDGVLVYLTNEQTNTTATINPKITEADGYMYLESVYSVSEGTFYNIRVEYDSQIIYRGKVYCTSQTNYQKYTVNQGQYVTENTHDNSFIVL